MQTIEKLENIEFCKILGFGALDQEGERELLYMYGRHNKLDPEGIYCSQNNGKSWNLLNYKKVFGVVIILLEI